MVAARHTLRQFVQALQRRLHIAIVKGPARHAQLHALAYFLFVTAPAACERQRLARMLIAARPVLQRMGTFGGQQVGQRHQAVAVGHGLFGTGQGRSLGHHVFSGLARADETPGGQVRHGVQQALLLHPLLLAPAPAPGVGRQGQQQGQAAQGGIQQQESRQQQEQNQVERQVDAARRWKYLLMRPARVATGALTLQSRFFAEIMPGATANESKAGSSLDKRDRYESVEGTEMAL